MIYTFIDGRWHVQQELSDHTQASACGLEVPFRAPWSRKAPTASHCPRCFPSTAQRASKPASKDA